MTAGFPVTPWSVIHAAAARGDPHAREALNALCATYWYPLYGYLRQKRYDREDASDLVQGFFARFVSKDYLNNLDPARGKFRSYLLKSLTNHAENSRKQQSTLRAGGQDPPISLEDLEERFAAEPATKETPEIFYERRWAVEVLRTASARLEERYRSKDEGHKFKVLREFARGPARDLTYAQAAEQLGLSATNVGVTINRFRDAYRRLIKEEVGRTVANPEDIDEELSYLIRVLEKGAASEL